MWGKVILIFEQDTRDPFELRPELFISKFDKKKTWRFVWGWWSLSCYASPGLKDFMKHISEGAARWG